MKSATPLPFTRYLAAIILGVSLTSASPGQADGPEALRHALVFAGTTIRTNNENWAYLLWQPGDDLLLEGRTLAIYRKTGNAQAVASYQLETVITGSWDARLATAVLNRATHVGDDLPLLTSALQSNFRDILPPATAGLAEMALYCIQTAMDKPELRGHIGLLARKHPGMAMLLGRAHASPLPGAGQVTFELRDYDPVKKRDRAVIGRTTVTVGQPLVLPKPHQPVLVPPLPGEEARTHLSARLRWATPDDLRALAIMQFGFNVYRLSASYVAQHNFPWQNPTLAQLQAATANPDGPNAAMKVNRLPVVPDDDLDDNAANDTGNDRSTVFFIDDNDALQGNTRFNDGDRFYYFITARDVLGRDGTPSPGTNIRICDEMPPLPPGRVRATPVYRFVPGNGATPAQGYHHFRVTWRDPGLRASDRGAEESIGGYYIYRWDSVPTMNLFAPTVNPATGTFTGGNPLAPAQGALVATVPAVAGQVLYSWDDLNGPRTPANTGTSYVYTVRAYDMGACGRNLSGDSGPAIVNLPDLELAASAGAGDSSITYATLKPTLTAKPVLIAGNTPADDTNWDIELQCTARSTGVADNVEFEWPPGTVLGHARFGAGVVAGQELAKLRVSFPYNAAQGTPVCRVHLRGGAVVAKAAQALGIKPTSGYKVVPWECTVERQTVTLGGGFTGPHVPDPEPPTDGAPPEGVGRDFVGATVHLVFPPGATRWRLYRQVDEGGKTLIAQGSAVGIPSIDVPDEQPPAGNCRLCFYQQTFDASDRPSELSLIDCVYQRTASTLPRPELAALENAKTSLGQPAMRLRWTCPPYTVERFLVQIETNGEVPLTGLAGLSDNLLAQGVESAEQGYWLSWHQTTRLQVMPDYPISSFTALVPVAADRTYRVTVQAQGPGIWPDVPLGEMSDKRVFVWNDLDSTGNGDPATGAPLDQSVGAGGTIPNSTLPWPARPLPPVREADNRFTLSIKKLPHQLAQLDPRFGPLVLVGATGQFNISALTPTVFEDANTGAITTRIHQTFDPRLLIYHLEDRGLLPCMLYRRQADAEDATFHVPAGQQRDWIQVSPLIEDIAFEAAGANNGFDTIIHDPWFVMPEPPTGTKPAELFLVDRHPVVKGMAYEYALVLFDNATKEPRSTLQLGVVTVK